MCDTPGEPICSDENTLRTYAGSGICSGGRCTYDFVDTTCSAGCDDGACLADPCAGQSCNTPPAPICQNASTLRTYANQGTCTDGTCTYAHVDTTCALGCANGACAPDPCGGKLCNTPPAPSCVNSTTLRTHAAAGTCNGGNCTYAHVDSTCAFGCSGGACKADPCAGISCNQPPPSACLNTTTLRTYAAAGACANGTCSYNHVDSVCANGCANGACKADPCAGVVCNTPPSACHAAVGTCAQGVCSYGTLSGTSCSDGNACTTGDTCQSGVCGGSPKVCDAPPETNCANQSLRIWSTAGTCAAGTCSYTSTLTPCPGGCVPSKLFVPAHCARGTWTPLPSAPVARSGHTAVWTGSKMLVWGGAITDVAHAYDPLTNSWSTTTAAGFAGRVGHSAVWTGSEMLVWGGRSSPATQLNTGARYDPATNTWTPLSTTNAPSARELHTAVWTGSEMLVWGGQQGPTKLATGARYNPATDTWIALPTPAPGILARSTHTATWTGSAMLVAGDGQLSDLDTAVYTPATSTWQKLTAPTYTDGRQNHTAVWTGTQLIAWGGADLGGALSTGAVYEPASNAWLGTIEFANRPSKRYSHTAVWTGTEMIVWGGRESAQTVLATGGIYNPSLSEWFTLATLDPPEARNLHTAVWTGSEMLVFGGTNGTAALATGGRISP